MSVRPHASALLEDLEAIRSETFCAAQMILDALETMGAELKSLPSEQSHIQARMREAIGVIAGGCAFQDLVGQRLSRIERGLKGLPALDDPLLGGPAALGEGLSQAEADALLDTLFATD